MVDKNKKPVADRDANRDPITGEPGAHPIGVGLGTAGGATAGAAIGAAAGPIGAAVGAIVGGVAGGFGGKAIAEEIDPTAEDAYWRDNYKTRPYYDSKVAYDEYQPAYQYGWESRQKYPDRTWDDSERDLAVGWERAKGKSKLGWEKVKHASKDAWHRVEHALPGDADGDGR